MVNLKDKAHNAVVMVKGNCGMLSKKVASAIFAVSVAASAMAINAFAVEDGSAGVSSSMYDEIANSFKSGITDCVAGIAKVVSVCIPVAIGVIGLIATVGAGKKIFMNPKIKEYISFMNWFIPVDTMIAMTEAWLTAIVIYYVVQVILRWANIVE